MPSLGFSIEHSFTRRRAPRRRGVGGRLHEVDALIAQEEVRPSSLRLVVGMIALGAAAGAGLAYSDALGALFHSLAGWL